MSERYIPASETEEIFSAAIHALDGFKSEPELIDWLKKSPEIRDGFQPNLGGSLLRDLHETVDPLSMVLRVHLYLEAFIDAILTRRLKYPEAILKNRDFTFAMKLDMLRASNRVNARLFHDIKRVNTLRNRFAHNLRFLIGDFDMTEFTYCRDFKERVARLRSDEAKASVNVYIFKLVAYFVLERLTKRHPYIAELA